MNLVMDEVEEYLPTYLDAGATTGGSPAPQTRSLGLVVLRGTALTIINPADGFEMISK